jgi:hypothetical protein
MRRREAVALLVTATAAWPVAVRAQQRAAAPTIGFLTIGFTTQMLLVDSAARWRWYRPTNQCRVREAHKKVN